MTAQDYPDFTALTEDRGILKKIIKEGNLELKPRKGDTVYVHYTGKYLGGEKDGEVFDSSHKRSEQFSFKLGVGDVISSWDKVVATMGVGEKCELIASPEYGYSDGHTRHFEIELFDFEGEDVSLKKDKSVCKSVVEEGDTATLPLVGTSITISYKKAGSEEEDKVVTYMLGDPVKDNVPVGIDEALRKMNMHERAIVKCKSSDKLSGDSSPFVLYDVFVKTYEKIVRLNTLDDFPKKMEYAEGLKGRANALVADQKYSIALEIYKRIDEDVLYLPTSGLDQDAQLKTFKLAIYSNMAQCYLKMNNTESCIEQCKKALEINSKHVKSIYKIGLAKVVDQDHEEACKQFRKVLEIEKDNKAAQVKLMESMTVVNKQTKHQKNKLRKIFEICSENGLGIVEDEPKETSNKKPGEDSDADSDSDESEQAKAENQTEVEA